MESKNTNYLAGISCPNCRAEDVFHIQIATVIEVTDSGPKAPEAREWDDRSTIVCCECGHTGIVAEFTDFHA